MPFIYLPFSRSAVRDQRGFSLLELSVVLVS